MAETLRVPAVALSLDSSIFSRNMRTINQQIKEGGSVRQALAFRTANSRIFLCISNRFSPCCPPAVYRLCTARQQDFNRARFRLVF